MWKPKWILRIKNNYRVSKYRNRLLYAIERLEKPLHSDLRGEDRQYKLEITRWLLSYYMGNIDAVGEGTPEIRLSKILRKKCNECNNRDHIYASVLFSWKEHKRIEGY